MQTQQFEDLLRSAIRETGLDLQSDLSSVAAYAAERTAILAVLVGQEGYDLAVMAERDNVALKMALQTVAASDAVRNRIMGIIQGALFMAASGLAKA